MKYIPYYLVLAGFAVAILIIPPRTVMFSFPAPQIIKNTEYPVEEKKTSLDIPIPKPLFLASIKTPVKPKSVVIATSTTNNVPTSQSSPSPTIPTASAPIMHDIPIDLRSVVVVKCFFKNTAGNQITAYGSGVVINSEGYVLTARHVVDMPYTYKITGGKQGLQDYFLDSCRIAIPPDGTKTPTPMEIRTMNPFTPVTEFRYNAQIAFVPPEPVEGGMSVTESDFVDSALLRITSMVVGTMPHSFIASPVKIFDVPAQGDEIISFGFPSGVPSYGSNFYLQGSVGETKDLIGGDQLFKNEPIGMVAIMETIGGRSGSPVFAHGYVVGVVSAKEDYSRNTLISAVFPIARLTEEAGLAVFK